MATLVIICLYLLAGFPLARLVARRVYLFGGAATLGGKGRTVADWDRPPGEAGRSAFTGFGFGLVWPLVYAVLIVLFLSDYARGTTKLRRRNDGRVNIIARLILGRKALDEHENVE